MQLTFYSAINQLFSAVELSHNIYYAHKMSLHFLHQCFCVHMHCNCYCDISGTTVLFKVYRYTDLLFSHFYKGNSRALDKREYLVIIRDNFCLICIKPYVVTTHLNRLGETVLMRGHNIWFR